MDSDDEKIYSIIKRVDDLYLECTNKDEFKLQLNLVLSNDEYIYDTSDESFIFIYSYIYKHREYLFDLNNTGMIQSIINESVQCINTIKELPSSSIYLRNTTIQVINNTIDELIHYLHSI